MRARRMVLRGEPPTSVDIRTVWRRLVRSMVRPPVRPLCCGRLLRKGTSLPALVLRGPRCAKHRTQVNVLRNSNPPRRAPKVLRGHGYSKRCWGWSPPGNYLKSFPAGTPLPRAPNQVLVVLNERAWSRYALNKQMQQRASVGNPKSEY